MERTKPGNDERMRDALKRHGRSGCLRIAVQALEARGVEGKKGTRQWGQSSVRRITKRRTQPAGSNQETSQDTWIACPQPIGTAGRTLDEVDAVGAGLVDDHRKPEIAKKVTSSDGDEVRSPGSTAPPKARLAAKRFIPDWSRVGVLSLATTKRPRHLLARLRGTGGSISPIAQYPFIGPIAAW